MPQFTPEEREELRSALVEAARADDRISAAAHLGSMALGRVDRWSDIDLALACANAADLGRVAGEWTMRMYDQHAAATHFDVRYGPAVYRVFLLHNTLQVDLSFWPADGFAPHGPAFKLIFGEVGQTRAPAEPDARDSIGMAWLHALHVRSSLARKRTWQAEYMLNGMRTHMLVLACRRHGLLTKDARGVDDLPVSLRNAFLETYPGHLRDDALRHAFSHAIPLLIDEVAAVDAALADRLRGPLAGLLPSHPTLP
jgi:predicted nucleotidyltransferase